MSSKRYTEEFKIEAVRQVTERGYSVAEVAGRLGMTTHSLYAWNLHPGGASPYIVSFNQRCTPLISTIAEPRTTHICC